MFSLSRTQLTDLTMAGLVGNLAKEFEPYVDENRIKGALALVNQVGAVTIDDAEVARVLSNEKLHLPDREDCCEDITMRHNAYCKHRVAAQIVRRVRDHLALNGENKTMANGNDPGDFIPEPSEEEMSFFDTDGNGNEEDLGSYQQWEEERAKEAAVAAELPPPAENLKEKVMFNEPPALVSLKWRDADGIEMLYVIREVDDETCLKRFAYVKGLIKKAKERDKALAKAEEEGRRAATPEGTMERQAAPQQQAPPPPPPPQQQTFAGPGDNTLPIWDGNRPDENSAPKVRCPLVQHNGATMALRPPNKYGHYYSHKVEGTENEWCYGRVKK